MTLKLAEQSPQIWGENLPFWFITLARLACFFLMVSGLFYWADMLGLFGQSGLERGPWQEVALRVVLSCSFLIAAIGVWQMTFWGVVMWVLSVITQAAAIIWFADFTAYRDLFTISHLLGLLLLAISCGKIYWDASKRME